MWIMMIVIKMSKLEFSENKNIVLSAYIKFGNSRIKLSMLMVNMHFTR